MRDTRDVMASPKPVDAITGFGPPIPGRYAMTCHKTEYEFGQSLKIGTGIYGSGLFDKSVTLRCDCGAAVTSGICIRCGNTKGFEVR